MPFDSVEFRLERTPPPAKRRDRGRFWDILSRGFRAPSLPPDPIEPAIVRVLEEARGLIAEREDWTQGEYETRGGERCAVGALRHSASLLNYPHAGAAALALLSSIARARGFPSVERMNDRSAHSQVLAAFDAAIIAAQCGAVGAYGISPDPRR